MGVIILSPSGVSYHAPARHSSSAVEANQALATVKGTPDEDVFGYYTNTGNGITNDWSESFDVEGKDLEEIAAELVNQI